MKGTALFRCGAPSPSGILRRSTVAYATVLLLFALAATLLTGCTDEEVAEGTKKAAEATAAIAPATPYPVSGYLTLASAILSAISAVAFGIRKWRNEILLKKAIRTRGDSIDLAKVSPDETLEAATKKVLKFVKERELGHTNPVKKSGGLFDAVRKGYK